MFEDPKEGKWGDDKTVHHRGKQSAHVRFCEPGRSVDFILNKRILL